MRAVVKNEMNLLLPNDQRNFFDSRGIVSFQEGLCHVEPDSIRNLLRAENTCDIPELSVAGC